MSDEDYIKNAADNVGKDINRAVIGVLVILVFALVGVGWIMSSLIGAFVR